MVGTPVAVTAIVVFVVVLLPRLSVAFSVMVSEPAVGSVSLSVPSAALTWASVPWMVRFLPAALTVAPPLPDADSVPLASLTVTVNVSAPVDPVSARLIPEIVVALLT